MKYRVLLADDHKGFREAVRDLLSRDPAIEVAAEARDGVEVLELAQTLRPDVVVLDIRMPGVKGFDAIRQLAAGEHSVKIIVCSHGAGEAMAAELIRIGASDFLSKDDVGTLPQRIHAVMAGQNAPSNQSVQPPAQHPSRKSE